jgi:hypothetical protein
MVLKLGHWKTDWKYAENFEMWCWRRMEVINWMDHVIYKKVLQRVKAEKNILCIIPQ